MANQTTEHFFTDLNEEIGNTACNALIKNSQATVYDLLCKIKSEIYYVSIYLIVVIMACYLFVDNVLALDDVSEDE